MTNTHPHYLYSDIVNSIKADKAVITAMTGLMDGTIAYATDTNEFGTYSLDTNTWTWVGASALLYVQDEGVPIGTPTTLNFVGNNINVSMSGTVARVFVTGSSSAAGSSFDNFWTSGSAGVYSIRAKNSGTVDAQGDNSFAIGNNTAAYGDNSVAEGAGTSAFSPASHVAGNGSRAYGSFSHAGGNISLVSGTAAFAMGSEVEAVGTYSAALGGMNNRVSGKNSVVLGGSGTIGAYDNTVFVPNLNIRNIQTGTPLLNLGADVNGNVVIGTTGSSSSNVLLDMQTNTYANQTGTTATIPADNTIPQNTEGTEVMSVTITPKSATSRLEIDVVLAGATNPQLILVMALFRDSTADAIAVASFYPPGGNTIFTFPMHGYVVAGSTNPTTFKVRIGPHTAGTSYINGTSGGRLFGATIKSSITVREYSA